jgi:hypothetical protein
MRLDQLLRDAGLTSLGEGTHRREPMGQIGEEASKELPVTSHGGSDGRERSVLLTNRGDGSVFFIRTPADSSEKGGCARLRPSDATHLRKHITSCKAALCNT